MNKKLSVRALVLICLLVSGAAYYAFTSSVIHAFFENMPLIMLAGLGTVGGLIVTGLVLFSAKMAVKKHKK